MMSVKADKQTNTEFATRSRADITESRIYATCLAGGSRQQAERKQIMQTEYMLTDIMS